MTQKVINLYIQSYSFFEYLLQTLIMLSCNFIYLIPISYFFWQLHHDKKEFEASIFGFGLSFFNFTSVYIYGIQEYFTLKFSQAYGDRNYKMMNQSFYQSLVYFILVSFIAFAINFQAYPLLKILGIEDHFSRVSARFIKINFVERFSTQILFFLQMILVCQKKDKKLVPINLLGVLAFLISNYTFYHYFDFG